MNNRNNIRRRPIRECFIKRSRSLDKDRGALLPNKLGQEIPAISLNAYSSLVSVVSNDICGDYIFAQQVVGYGNQGGILLGNSTSWNLQNAVNAYITAKTKGRKVIALFGKKEVIGGIILIL